MGRIHHIFTGPLCPHVEVGGPLTLRPPPPATWRHVGVRRMVLQAGLPPAKRGCTNGGRAGLSPAQESPMAAAFMAATGRIAAKARRTQAEVPTDGAQP